MERILVITEKDKYLFLGTEAINLKKLINEAIIKEFKWLKIESSEYEELIINLSKIVSVEYTYWKTDSLNGIFFYFNSWHKLIYDLY